MPTISDFWLSGKLLHDPDEDDRLPDGRARPTFYGIEYGEHGPLVHRFKYRGELALWLASAEPGTRERILARDPRVESALARDEWGEHDESIEPTS